MVDDIETRKNYYRSGKMGIRQSKIVALEGYRGLAAIVVVGHHLVLAFAPAKDGILAGLRARHALAGTPWFVLINGPAAVAFFFVLSGYVLTRRFFQTRDPALLLQGLIKRLPRLAGLATVSTLASCALFKWRLYDYIAAAAVSGSPWLGHFGFAGIGPGFQPSWLGAFRQGAWRNFSRGENFYNTNLWTMRVELIGSIFVYGLAFIYDRIGGPRRIWAVFAACATVLWWLPLPALAYDAAFLFGATLSFFHARRPPRMGVWTAAGLLVLAVYLLGYILPEGAYGLFVFDRAFIEGPLRATRYGVWIHALASVILIHATVATPAISRLLDNAAGRLLGEISFPVYLIHVIVICSFSSALYLRLAPVLPAPALFATVALATLIVVAVAAGLLARADGIWVKWLTRVTDRLVAVVAQGPAAGPERTAAYLVQPDAPGGRE